MIWSSSFLNSTVAPLAGPFHCRLRLLISAVHQRSREVMPAPPLPFSDLGHALHGGKLCVPHNCVPHLARSLWSQMFLITSTLLWFYVGQELHGVNHMPHNCVPHLSQVKLVWNSYNINSAGSRVSGKRGRVTQIFPLYVVSPKMFAFSRSWEWLLWW